MSEIKYNQFGEVVSVNGLTTGHHIGTPMQDALGSEVDNSAYGTELQTVRPKNNLVDDLQPSVGNSSNDSTSAPLVINVDYNGGSCTTNEDMTDGALRSKINDALNSGIPVFMYVNIGGAKIIATPSNVEGGFIVFTGLYHSTERGSLTTTMYTYSIMVEYSSMIGSRYQINLTTV